MQKSLVQTMQPLIMSHFDVLGPEQWFTCGPS